MLGKSGYGKGSMSRITDLETYRKNYETIYGPFKRKKALVKKNGESRHSNIQPGTHGVSGNKQRRDVD